MNSRTYDEELQKELRNLNMIREQIMKSLKNAPEGRIRGEMSRGKYPQYYFVNKEELENHPCGRYLKKEEIGLAKRCVQKEYDEKMLAAIDKREEEIKRYIKMVDSQDDVKRVFSKMPISKQMLVAPYILPDDDFVEEWYQAGNGEENPFPIGEGFLTEKGEKVRSKSEKMIADKLYFKGIIYKYEAKLVLENHTCIFPDFTLLNSRTRQTIYLEHFGMMDDPDYCKKALERIDLYAENHIYQGEQLFITFESSNKSINLKQIDTLIERILL